MAIVNPRGVWSAAGFSMFCFVIAVFLKISLKRIFFIFGADKFGQIVITKNLLNGHGFSIDTVSTSDLSRTIYQFSADWGIGYNLLLSPLLLITNGDFITAALLVDFFTAIIFCWYLRKIYFLIGFSMWLTNLMLVFQASFISKEVDMSAHTDFLAMTLMLAALYHLTKFLSSSSRRDPNIYYAIAFLLFTGLSRNQYIPVVVCLLLVTQLVTFFNNKRQHLRSLTFSLTALLVFFGLLLLYLFEKTANPYFLSKIESGFFPSNLLHTYPFILASFVNLHFLAVQFAIITGSEYSYWMNIARWINLPVVVIVVTLFLRYQWKRRFQIHNAAETFVLLAGLSAILVLGELMFLSVSKSIHTGPPQFSWTFGVSGRYFALIQVIIHTIVAWCLFCRPAKVGLKKWIQTLFLAVTFLEIMHGTYYVTKKLIHPVPLNQTIVQNPLFSSVIQFIQEQHEKDPGIKILVTAFDKQYGFLANLYGGTGYFTPSKLNDSLPKSSSKAIMLIMVRKKEAPYLSALLARPNVQYLYQLHDYFYYKYIIEPT